MIELVFAGWGLSTSLCACLGLLLAMRDGARLVWLARLVPKEPNRWPKLSVIVPARDEGATIGAGLRSLCDEDYPELEIIAVDDRSTDDTGAQIDAAAAADARVQALHLRELPPGWLGKVHALDRGLASSTGEWVLFTDADVEFRRGTLRRAVAHALEAELDHLTLTPGLRPASVWLEIAQVTFGIGFILGTRAATLGADRSSAYAGVGAFNLVRRSVLDLTPGFEWLRLEVLDDVGLGLMIRRAGGRSRLLVGDGQIELDWYPSLGAMIRGLEKNFFPAVARFRLWRAVAVVLALALFALGPLFALAHPWFWPRAAGLAAVGCLMVFAIAAHLTAGRRLLAMLLLPLGVPILGWALLRSAALGWRRGGIDWRGTHYSIESLRAGQRVRL